MYSKVLLTRKPSRVGYASQCYVSLIFQDIALVRGRIAQLNSLISQLKSAEMLLEAPSNKSREQRLDKLVKDLSKCQTSFFDAITLPSRDPESLVGSTDAGSEEMATISEQENQLDYVLGTATNLKELGIEINEEIGVHCRLLDEIESREDAILGKQARNAKLLKQFSDRSSLTWLWGFVFFLFLTFIYVLLW